MLLALLLVVDFSEGSNNKNSCHGGVQLTFFITVLSHLGTNHHAT